MARERCSPASPPLQPAGPGKLGFTQSTNCCSLRLGPDIVPSFAASISSAAVAACALHARCAGEFSTDCEISRQGSRQATNWQEGRLAGQHGGQRLYTTTYAKLLRASAS